MIRKIKKKNEEVESFQELNQTFGKRMESIQKKEEDEKNTNDKRELNANPKIKSKWTGLTGMPEVQRRWASE
ncbi:hypothetical protein RCL_jg8460.t1 [Rhizophagus clarus]|uniref:Uncharacterized protein n=1 Tax=Rhizophagus clarus TaxID=94130 RepID=A0A8H3MG20_9GLOM|nr:hypothetical protein RCL_jg8460.t1 [Rhizophagus clarus]